MSTDTMARADVESEMAEQLRPPRIEGRGSLPAQRIAIRGRIDRDDPIPRPDLHAIEKDIRRGEPRAQMHDRCVAQHLLEKESPCVSVGQRGGTLPGRLLEQQVHRVADEKCGRLRPSLEEETGVVQNVPFAPVRKDAAAGLPEQTDCISFRAITASANRVEECWLQGLRRLNGSGTSIGILAVGVTPGEDRFQPALGLVERRRIGIGQTEDSGDHRDR